MRDQPIQVLLANLPSMLADLLSRAFETVPEIKIVQLTNDVRQLRPQIQAGSIDVIVMGSASSGSRANTVEMLEHVVQTSSVCKVLILAQKPDYSETVALFRAGARGIFCISNLRFDLLCKSVRCVSEGQIWADNGITNHIVAALSRPRATVVVDLHGRKLLTSREQEVLNLLADGLSNQELAATLNLSEHTIKNHLFRIYDKLGVSNRMEAVLYALNPRYPAGVGTAAHDATLVHMEKTSGNGRTAANG